MLPAAQVPVFDGRGTSSINYGHDVRRRFLDSSKRAAPKILQMETAACQVCLAAGSDFVTKDNAARRIPGSLKDYLAPYVVHSVHTEADGPHDGLLPRGVRFVKPRSGIQDTNGRGVPPMDLRSPDGFAALQWQERSLELASVQGGLDFLDVANTVRRVFGQRGGSAREDVSLAADADSPSKSGKYNEARVAYRKAKKQSGMKRKEEKGSRKG